MRFDGTVLDCNEPKAQQRSDQLAVHAASERARNSVGPASKIAFQRGIAIALPPPKFANQVDSGYSRRRSFPGFGTGYFPSASGKIGAVFVWAKSATPGAISCGQLSICS